MGASVTSSQAPGPGVAGVWASPDVLDLCLRGGKTGVWDHRRIGIQVLGILSLVQTTNDESANKPNLGSMKRQYARTITTGLTRGNKQRQSQVLDFYQK